MKKKLMVVLFAFSLIFLSSCIKVVTMSDIELILIDEGFSIIEYQESQINAMKLWIEEVLDDDIEILRVVEGRKNQETLVYVIAFDSISQATIFKDLIQSDEEIENIEFEYLVRKGNIVILAITDEVLSLFKDI